jgi:hypothetical protein
MVVGGLAGESETEGFAVVELRLISAAFEDGLDRQAPEGRE